MNQRNGQARVRDSPLIRIQAGSLHARSLGGATFFPRLVIVTDTNRRFLPAGAGNTGSALNFWVPGDAAGLRLSGTCPPPTLQGCHAPHPFSLSARATGSLRARRIRYAVPQFPSSAAAVARPARGARGLKLADPCPTRKAFDSGPTRKSPIDTHSKAVRLQNGCQWV